MNNIEKIKRFVGTKRQMLTAIKVISQQGSKQIWLFGCVCGGFKEKVKGNFLISTTNNCGCKHGLTKHDYGKIGKNGYRPRIYRTWLNMRSRCNTPNRPDYRFYGGRGIKVCKRWDNFANFLQDMGEPPKKYTIDRIDNNKGYFPQNCKWATRKEQSNNRNYNRQITYKGKTQSVGKWASEIPIDITTRNLYKRIFTRNWDIKRAFTQKVS